MAVKPTKPVPKLEVETLGGEPFRLAERYPETFSMVVFYRGLHCPICKTWLRDLDRRLEDFATRGVEVIAVSCDSEDRAAQSQTEWGLEQLPIGYGLPVDRARDWGLYISKGIKEGEPAAFAEPGLFLVRPDGTLYAGIISTMPFARPHFDEVLSAIGFVLDKSYPPRGEA